VYLSKAIEPIQLADLVYSKLYFQGDKLVVPLEASVNVKWRNHFQGFFSSCSNCMLFIYIGGKN